ncbi:MAG: glycerophosphodiester phosphodiesterase family protein [Kineosporiaceae bacterium]
MKVPVAPLRPRVIAHRGASADLPEHTPAAYRRAIEDGADGLECDVRLSADGQLICLHDARVDRTSSGRGSVSGLSADRLEALDWGGWRLGPDASADPVPGCRELLTLRALCELVRDAGRPLELAIETKHPNRFGGHVEQALAELLTEFGWHTPDAGVSVRMMSFSAMAVRRMHRLTPELPLVYLVERIPRMHGDGSLPAGCRIAGLDITLVRDRPEYVADLVRAGQELHVWTVDEPEDVRRCLDLGVQAIITNRPREVASWITADGHPGGLAGAGALEG